MEVIQVVKRFGLCGGMEEYAFRLTEKLSKMGIKVKVLCEVQLTSTQDDIVVIELGKGISKPRWLSHIQFSNKVSIWVKNNVKRNEIVHSHERISCHHVTTIHSTLFNFPRKGLPSLRKYMNEYLEKREMSSKRLKKVVPVSHLISKEIKVKFPFVKNVLNKPIPPGISPINCSRKKPIANMLIIGFIGKEWKRKGLPKLIQIWRAITPKYPNSKLCLAGFPKNEDIGLTNEEASKVELLGFVHKKEDFYSKIDLLLHPAKKEAYGMVIAEACSLGIPVVCSKECGASYSKLAVRSLHYSESINFWTKEVLKCIEKLDQETSIQLTPSWNDTAKSYSILYKSLMINEFDNSEHA